MAFLIFLVPTKTILIAVLSVMVFVAIGTFACFVLRQRMRKQRENNHHQQQQQHNREHGLMTTENVQKLEADEGYEPPLNKPKADSNRKLPATPTQKIPRQKNYHKNTVTGIGQQSNDRIVLPLNENVCGEHLITMHIYTCMNDLPRDVNRQKQQNDEACYEMPLHEYHSLADSVYDTVTPSNESHNHEIQDEGTESTSSH
jgi:uncharacterized protein YpmB